MRKRKPMAITAIVILLILGVFCAAVQFPLLCGLEVPKVLEAAVLDQAEGLYSKRLPLMPVVVRITGFDRERVYYTIDYFPFGSVGMSYHPQDGYNIEKPLGEI